MNRIKQLREEFDFSQNDLAQKIGGAPSSIAMYEKGERKPSLEVLVKLSEIFDCSIDYILCKSDIRKPDNQIKEEFTFAYHKEAEGLTDEEIADAIRFYKQIKYGKNNKG
ncbi:MAG: helix-turn-helix transcriptional regulator [Clostridia bacterium]|nr:helix-turn-helix transcriptional regulator [Clostridia bacterium]